MKNYIQFLIIVFYLSFLTGFSAKSAPVDFAQAKLVATHHLVSTQKSADFKLIEIENKFLDNENHPLFYLFDLQPVGYIIVSAENELPPLIAYSFTNDAGVLTDEANILILFLKSDLSNRISNLQNLPQEVIQQRKAEWQEILAGTDNTALTQQWPPEGTTVTGGWLKTNWTQSGIYDDMCPMDPVTNQRSLAGCPATAMAQILNFYETTNGTSFTDADDYYHNYSGRKYWIDDDYIARDFPSFSVLNAYLDTISSCYSNGSTINDAAKAALTFACGVAAHQVYTSQGSGTFGVNQAEEAYLRFGFSDNTFFDGTDTSLYTTLAQNMMGARPAHLAIVNPGWTSGHNVVVDGYNTHNYFHLNFGWGGSYNGWYHLPDEIPYGLTVIEGLVADIAYPPSHTGTETPNTSEILKLNIYPNPVNDKLTMSCKVDQTTIVKIEIYDLKGIMLFSFPAKRFETGLNIETLELQNQGKPALTDGLYICRIQAGEKVVSKRFIIQH